MNELSIVDKLVLHFHDPKRQSMTKQMEEHLMKMDFCYDIITKFSQKSVVQMIQRKFPNTSRSKAYEIYRDTQDFYEKEKNKSYTREFWKIVAIEYLEELMRKAELKAKTPKDFDYVARIQARINKLRGFEDKNPPVDPESLKPSTLLINLGNGTSIALGKKPEELPENTPIEIEAIDFTVEDMEKELKKSS